MKYSKKKETSITGLIPWLPVGVTLILLPLLTGYNVYDSRISSYPWNSGAERLADVFLYCKQELFSLLSLCFLLLCILDIWKRKKNVYTELRKQWYMLIPAGIYLLLALLSALCSEHKIAAFFGSNEQFESFFCMAGYLLFVIYLLLYIKKEEDLLAPFLSLAVLSVILGIFGVLQYTGNDPFMWTWVQKLITPDGYLETFGPVTSVFEEGRVSLASYNPNYAGVLLTLLISLCYGLMLTEKNKKTLVIELFVLVLLLVALVGTGSKAGFLVCLGVAVLGILFRINYFRKKWKIVIPVAAVLLISAILAVNFSTIPIMENIKIALSPQKSPDNPLDSVTTSDTGISFNYQGIERHISYYVMDGGFYVSVTDAEGTEYEVITSPEDMAYYFQEPELHGIVMRPMLVGDGAYGIVLQIDGRNWEFISLNNSYYYINHFGNLEKLNKIEKLGFEGYESFASARGLIWSVTLPLLKEHLLLGSGANTFVFEYPQNNYSDLYFYTGEASVATRPHCWYLQTAVESGVAALLCLMVFLGWYLIHSLNICLKSGMDSISGRISFACFLATVSYAVCGLTNDSMITVAPVFWGILGLGMAANRLEAIRLKNLNSKSKE